MRAVSGPSRSVLLGEVGDLAAVGRVNPRPENETNHRTPRADIGSHFFPETTLGSPTTTNGAHSRGLAWLSDLALSIIANID
jgi:hypothetical protein